MNRRTPHAFTLIELLIVVSIMAVVLTIGLPSLFSVLAKNPLRQAVSDILGTCAQARARAIIKGVPTDWVLRATDGSMEVHPLRRFTPSSQDYGSDLESLRDTGDKDGKETPRLHRDIAIELLFVNLQEIPLDQASEVRVRFYPNGTSDELAMVISWELGAQRMIVVDPITGLAEIQAID